MSLLRSFLTEANIYYEILCNRKPLRFANYDPNETTGPQRDNRGGDSLACVSVAIGHVRQHAVESEIVYWKRPLFWTVIV